MGGRTSHAEAIESYLFTVFRYILQNPEKAGICPAPEYRWSSYHLFENPPAFMDLDPFRSQLGDFEHYRAFLSAGAEDECLEFRDAPHNDQWARSVMQKELAVRSGTELQDYDRKARDPALCRLRSKGLTIRQIERLTGINRNIVQRAAHRNP